MSGARAHANKEEINEQHKENERKIAAARRLINEYQPWAPNSIQVFMKPEPRTCQRMIGYELGEIMFQSFVSLTMRSKV